MALPKCILLDWQMPVMNGMAFLQALRSEFGPDGPAVIFCTAENERSHATLAIEAGRTRLHRETFRHRHPSPDVCCLGPALKHEYAASLLDPARVVLCDDSAIVRAALGRILQAVPGIRVVARTANGQSAIEAVQQRRRHQRVGRRIAA